MNQILLIGNFVSMTRAIPIVCGILCLFWLNGSVAQDWPYYGATKGGIKYSAAKEINRSNVEDLEIAWLYRTGEAQRRGKSFPGSSFQNTPVTVAGSLIVCSPFERIIALDPESGAERWVFEPDVKLDYVGALPYKCRGVASWTDKEAPLDKVCRTRILVSAVDFRLIAIDAKTGLPCKEFGVHGTVQIAHDKEPIFAGETMLGDPPAIVNDVVVVGSAIMDGVRANGPSGMVRAFDVRTGAALWTFDPVPRNPDHPLHAGWGGSASTIGAANVWSIMSVDEKRDLVFLPTSSPSNDYFGGGRRGDNRYSNSVVALRGTTGEVAWHFQTSHHDVWDYDIPAQPILFDMKRDGRTIPALAQITKQSFVFVLNRETGEPLFPVEERPVPQDGVKGEWLSPTQPFPVAPPPFVKQGLSIDDAWGFTFIDKKSCRDQFAAAKVGGIYTPPSLQGTVLLPGLTGGGNWGGGALDPDSGVLIVNSTRVPTMIKLIPASESENRAGVAEPSKGGYLFPQSGARYKVDTSFPVSSWGAPCTKPPWGGLTAIDLRAGTIKWDVPLGSIHLMLPGLPFTWDLGTPVAGGPIVTAGGLIFVASTMDNMFRAFSLETGEELWHTDLPAGGQSTPMTYVAGGRQYVVLTAGGHPLYRTKSGDFVIAFALPQ